MEKTTLTRHQLAMLEMLRETDRICKKHRIRYMLFAGTALGAVRHGGFIPWDDDLDILMLREEYERFLRVAPKELDERYCVQKEFSAHWPMFFSKLRMNGTTCMEKFHPRDPEMHQGVYIDIFPCDNLYNHALLRRAQYAASKLVIAKALYQRGYETGSLAKKLLMQLSRLAPTGLLRRFVQARGAGSSRMMHTFFGASSRYSRSIYPRPWLLETDAVAFEDGVFPVSAHADELLTTLYGQWRRVPPPEERACKVHGAIVDLDRPYTDYLAQQQDMKIEVYSRSIR